jgi:hypothetical protein
VRGVGLAGNGIGIATLRAHTLAVSKGGLPRLAGVGHEWLAGLAGGWVGLHGLGWLRVAWLPSGVSLRRDGEQVVQLVGVRHRVHVFNAVSFA